MGLFDKFKKSNNVNKPKKEETQEELLEKVNNTLLNLEVREDALNKITDDNILFNIALDKKYDKSLRFRAIKKISNQDLLMEIATSNDSQVDYLATMGLDEPNLLLIIANTKLSTTVRKEALFYTNSQSIFAACAKTPDEDIEIRKDAIRYLSDKELLVKIAKNEDNPEIRRHAIDYGGFDDETLSDLLKNEKDEDVRYTIKRKQSASLMSGF